MQRAAAVLLCCLAGAPACGGPSDAATGSPGPAVVGLRVTPHTTSLRAGETVQFDAAQQLSDGSSTHVRPQFRATGGSISSSGLFTAGTSPGTFTVIAFDANTQLADTAIVTVLAPSQQPPPTGYARVVGDDWQGYGSNAALFARQYFYWVDAAGRNVYDYVSLVPDATFGQAVRITFPQNTGSPGSSPRLAVDLPTPLDRMWYRWRMKFTPGWTTVGPDPAGSANSYKIAFWLWKNAGGRGEVEYSNTSDYITGTGIQDAAGNYLRYNESLLPGSAANFGHTDTEWSDGQWWEFVVYYQKTGPTSARQYYWRRRLTNGGQIANNSWVFHGYEMTGSATPQVAGIELGINKNKNNPQNMYITWGLWEVVDGSRYPNPFSMPNVVP